MSVRRHLLLPVALAASLAAGCATGQPPTKVERPMAPNEVNIPVPALNRTLVLAAPAYLSSSVEDTPYQWLKLCDESAKSC